MDKETFEQLVFQNGIQLGDSPYDPTKLTIDVGTDAAPDDLFSSATYNKIKNHWIGGAATDPQDGMIRSVVAGKKLEHYNVAWEEILQLTRSLDVTPQFAGCNLVNGELTAGSINRAAGTLTLEIAGAPIASVSAAGLSVANLELTCGSINRGAGALTLEIGGAAVASISLAGLGISTLELTCGSINRAAGTLSLEIGGTSVIDILATYVNVKQNLFVNETAMPT